jgi:hypothetical protein
MNIDNIYKIRDGVDLYLKDNEIINMLKSI